MTSPRLFALSILLVLATPAGRAAPAEPAGEVIQYEVASVKRKLLRELADGSERLAPGAELRSQDLLRTGWFSRAEITAPAYAAGFHLAARTRVRLAGGTPGLLLELEKGRLRALFDRLSGQEPTERVVTTPSAVLAVRGTEYGAGVDSGGDTTVTVFSGMVEVIDRQRQGPPVQVRQGFYTTVPRGKRPTPPRQHQMSRRDWDRGGRPGSPHRGPDGSRGGGGGGMGPDGRHGGSGGSGGSGQRGGRSGGSGR